MFDMTNTLLKQQEVASILNISIQTLGKWRKANGGPRCYKIGGSYRYPAADFEEWLTAQTIVADNHQPIVSAES